MSKDPAFLFYYQDFAYGTRQMTFAEKGCYIELLCEQADLGHLSMEDVKRSLKDSLPIWESICYKFDVDEKGLFYNKVLEKHMEERKKFVESRLSNLKSPHKASHMASHMENVNGNVIRNKIPKNTTNPTKVIQDFFYQEYEKAFGEKYVANFAKDGAIFKDILKVLPELRIKDLIIAFFLSTDEFIQKTGYTVGVFKSQINKLKNPTTALDKIYAKAGLRKE
jgi:hypothetical protein